MVEIREAPVPVRWAWLAKGEPMTKKYVPEGRNQWWRSLSRDEWVELPWPRLQILLSNGQTIIVRAKK